MSYNTKVDTRSLYIHWPFCPYKCHFCPFVAFAGQDNFMEQYHKALCTELDMFGAEREETGQKQYLDTIFMGGGTPSTYPDQLLLDMSAILNKRYIISPTTEFTIEVNPGTVRQEQLDVWQQVGINRLSIGVQGLNDTVLRSLNRHQSRSDVYQLLEWASGKFNAISVDLIIGLPGVSSDDWKALIGEVVTWPIQHVSIYFLTIHEQTPLYYKVQDKSVTLPLDDTVVDLYHWSIDMLRDNGFMQYEISNFAKQGYQSRHNCAYWERVPYKGVGVGACSFDGERRIQNDKNLMNYLRNAGSGSDTTLFEELLTGKQSYLERIMLGMRRSIGVSYAMIAQDSSIENHEKLGELLEQLCEQKLVTRAQELAGNYVLTPAGLVVENEIVVRISQLSEL